MDKPRDQKAQLSSAADSTPNTLPVLNLPNLPNLPERSADKAEAATGSTPADPAVSTSQDTPLGGLLTELDLLSCSDRSVSISNVPSDPEPSPSLEEMLSELDALLSLELLPLRRWDITLLRNVSREVKEWNGNRESSMSCNAQIALAHSAVDLNPTSYVDWGKPPGETSLIMYLHLVQRACDSGLFDGDMIDTLQTAIHDSKEPLVNGSSSCTDQLDILHVICDYYVAYHSIAVAVKYLKESLSTIRPHDRGHGSNMLRRVNMSEELSTSDRVEDINCAIQTFTEYLEGTSGADRPRFLGLLAATLGYRFGRSGDLGDLDDAIERLQEAVNLVPADSNDHARYLRLLNRMYTTRLDVQENNTVRRGPKSNVQPTAQSSLEVLLSQLSGLISLDDASSLLGPELIILRNLHNEIESWVNDKGSSMIWDAQIAMVHSSKDAAAVDYINWSKRPAEISVVMYLYLMRRTHDKGLLDEDVGEMLQVAIQDAEDWLMSLDASASDSAYAEQLATLQAVGDYSVACSNIAEAIEHIKGFLGSKLPILYISGMLERSRTVTELIDSNVPELLNQSIQMLLEFLMFVDGAERLAALGMLAHALYQRFKERGDKRDLDTALEQFEEVIMATDSSDGVTYLCGSAQALHARFILLGDLEDVNLAIIRFQQVLSFVSPGDKDYLVGTRGLARSLSSRFIRLGHIEDVDRAIELWQEMVKLLPVDSEDYAQCLAELGIRLRSRFGRYGNTDDLDAGIHWLQEAHKRLPSHPSPCHNLAIAFLTRYEQYERIEDLDSGILLCYKAVELESSASSMSNLANAIVHRFKRFGKVEDIDLAIEVGQKALDITALDDPDLPGRLSNQGIRLRDRAKRLKRRSDLDKALMHHQRALDLAPLDDVERTLWSMNLANCFVERYRAYEESDDIDRAIELLQGTLDSYPPNNPHRPGFLYSLGNSFMTRFDRLGGAKDLESAIELQQEAARLKPDSTIAHVAIGELLRRRYEQFGKLADLDLAIEHNQMAVKLTPSDHYSRSHVLWLYGYVLVVRFNDQHESQDYVDAVSAWQSSCSCLYGEPKWRLTSAWTWAVLSHDQNQLESAAEGYHQAIQLLPLVIWIGLGATSQLSQITDNQHQIQNLACDAAACMFSLAEAHPEERQYYLGQAVTLLDQGRSILWSQASQLKQDLTDLREVNARLAEELDDVGRMISMRVFDDRSTSETEDRAYRRAAQRWEQLMDHVRKLPGFESFLLPLPVTELRKAAKDGPIVIINTSEYRLDVLIMPLTGELIHVPMSKEAANSVKVAAYQASQSAPKRELELRIGRPAIPKADPLDVVLSKTWMLLGQPILHQLGVLGLLGSPPSLTCHVWWCLTGSLAFLPIHAAHPPPTHPGQHLPGMMDLVVSSYTPTISALLRSQRSHSRASRSMHLLAIGQSDDLPMVKEELDAIRSIIPKDQLTILEDEQATLESVSHHLPKCTWAHFACHGVQDHVDPINSSLKMHDAPLTLSNIAQLSLPSADFAFLSCCQSATGSMRYTNESMHIAAGIQFVGFCSVIGTLWSVGDTEARIVAERVYKEFFQDGVTNPDSSRGALMLNQAVRYLRDVQKVSLERWVPFAHFGA